jgi:hypothetical protein
MATPGHPFNFLNDSNHLFDWQAGQQLNFYWIIKRIFRRNGIDSI